MEERKASWTGKITTEVWNDTILQQLKPGHIWNHLEVLILRARDQKIKNFHFRAKMSKSSTSTVLRRDCPIERYDLFVRRKESDSSEKAKSNAELWITRLNSSKVKHNEMLRNRNWLQKPMHKRITLGNGNEYFSYQKKILQILHGMSYIASLT